MTVGIHGGREFKKIKEYMNCIIYDLMDVNLSKLQETVKDRGAWPVAVHGVTKNPICLRE